MNHTFEEERAAHTAPRADLWIVGMLLDCVATLGGATGKQLLRHAALRNRRWVVPLAMLCTVGIDGVFDVSAYAFAAQSVIAPMAGLVVVWNVLLAPFTLGEVLTPTRKWGALLVVIGTACAGFFSNHSAHDLSVDEYLRVFSRPLAVLYYVCFAVISGSCVYFLKHGSHYAKGFAAGAWGGLLAGNMMTTKAAVEMIKCEWLHSGDPVGAMNAHCLSNPFYTPWPYLFIVISLTLACSALYLLSMGLRSFEALYLITVFEGFMVISGAVSGNLVLNEKEGHPPALMALYFCSVLLILAGLYVLSSGEHRAIVMGENEISGLARHDGEQQRSDQEHPQQEL